MPNRFRGRALRQAARAAGRGQLLEPFESRILLAAFVWSGAGAPLNTWSNLNNWTVGGLVPTNWPGQVAANNDTVEFDSTAPVTVDVSPTVSSIAIIAQAGADANVTFSFNQAAPSLTVTNDIDLDTVNNQNAGITLLAANATVGGVSVRADNLEVPVLFPAPVGSDSIDVGAHVILRLTDDLDTESHVTTVLDDGAISVGGNVSIQGGAAPAPASTITVNHMFVGKSVVLLGGAGFVDATVNAGAHLDVNPGLLGSLELGAGSTINDDGTISVDQAFIGDVPGGALSLDPATVLVSSSGTFDASASLDIVGGTGTSFTVNGGQLSSPGTTVGPADGPLGGPVLTITNSGTASGTASLGATEVGLGDLLHAPGELVVDTGATATATSFSAYTQRNELLLPSTELLVNGQLTVALASLGNNGGAGVDGGRMQINGTLKATAAGLDIHIGEGNIWQPTIVDVNGWMIGANNGFELDEIGAIVRRKARIQLAYVQTAGPGAEFSPGDGSDPSGSLTIDGDLNASAGMTLDSVIGDYGSSNCLAVTGTMTLGGPFAGQLDVTSLATLPITAGDSYTIATAGALSGWFSDLPIISTSGSKEYSAYFLGSDVGLSSNTNFWQLVWDSSAGTLDLVDAGDALPDPGAFIWVGGGTNSSWANPNNWRRTDSYPTVHYGYPTGSDEAIFDGSIASGANPNLPADEYAGSMEIENNYKFPSKRDLHEIRRAA